MSKLALFGGSPLRTSKFHGWPVYKEEEEASILKVLHANKTGLGKRTGVLDEFEKKFSEFHQAPFAIACTNCTQALEIMLAAYDIGPGDEVILPAYTFIATASCVTKVGATPVFADINYKTLLIDLDKLEELVTPNTKAIIAVHFAGQFVDMERVMAFAAKHGLKVIEDSAQAHGARWKDKSPGFYAPATFSFQYSKNMTAGEGGIIISHDEGFINKCWEQVWHGRKKGGLWYEHFETTSNYRMTEWSAAILLPQLDRLAGQNKTRMENAHCLERLLEEKSYVFSTETDSRVQVHPRHLFPIQINRNLLGDIPKARLVEALLAEGIPVLPGYKFPLYKNPAFQNGNWGNKRIEKKDYRNLILSSSENACSDTVWLIHNTLLGTEEDMKDINSAVTKVCENLDELK